jgi:hypothetical protein
VPPVPWRRIAVGGLVAAIALAALAAYAIPRIDDSKRRAAERERTAAAAREARERRRLVRDQRPMRGRARSPSRRMGPEGELRARQALLARVEREITRDARRRHASGALEGRALRTECVPAPSSIERVGAERRLGRRVDAYDCLAVTSDIRATEAHRAGALGHPFRAVVDYRRFTFTWCKTNPPPGERAVPDPRQVPELPRACRIP